MEKAPIDTSDVEEKAEEIIAEAEPPLEVYLYWMVFFSNNMIHNTFGIIKIMWRVYILVCFLKHYFIRETVKIQDSD